MIERLAAIDIGNDAVKGYVGNLDTEIYIPNVIAEIGPTREIIEYEKNILDGLHVEIISGALKRGKGIFAVGKLASGNLYNDELTVDSEKSESDQAIVMLLTALAYDAVSNFPETNVIIEANYFLSTGIPLSETKKKKRKSFKEKLVSHHHEVKFLDTPEIGGKKVRVKFSDVIVSTEGHAAMIDLTTNNDGSLRNEDLTKMKVLINDIGGLTTDSAIINIDGSIDNLHSEGIKEGVSPYLDKIMDRVFREYGYQFSSRRQLVDVITAESTEEKNHIWLKGNRHSIKHIVDETLILLAKEEYKHIKLIWLQVPDIRVAYLIGGGALVLKPYIEELNAKEEKYPMRFVSHKESIWIIARAYYKLLIIYLNQKGINVEAAASHE